MPSLAFIVVSLVAALPAVALDLGGAFSKASETAAVSAVGLAASASVRYPAGAPLLEDDLERLAEPFVAGLPAEPRRRLESSGAVTLTFVGETAAGRPCSISLILDGHGRTSIEAGSVAAGAGPARVSAGPGFALIAGTATGGLETAPGWLSIPEPGTAASTVRLTWVQGGRVTSLVRTTFGVKTFVCRTNGEPAR